MITEVEELHRRVDKIEIQKNREVLALVEILSNATFFGEMKMANCEYAKKGQCSFFILENETKNKIPIVTQCLIEQCNEPSRHCHIEISNISSTLCQQTNKTPEKPFSLTHLKKIKGTRQNIRERSLSRKNGK